MKKLFLLQLIACAFLKLNAQPADNYNAIKLFTNLSYVQSQNADLPAALQDRLYRKVTQLINQSGVAEIGYSTFFISPKLDILSTSVNEAGISKVYLADCEFYMSISRVSLNENLNGGAIFNSFSKKITGSGLNKDDAISNALNNISVNDKSILSFISNSKQKIDAYFKANCEDVMKQAERALVLNDYPQAIALFQSVPASAPCYDRALQRSEGVYTQYVNDECDKKIMKLKTFTALAQTNDTYYDSVMNTVANLQPASQVCNSEANQIISKIENRLSEEQKKQWELTKQVLSDNAAVKKEMYKAMGEISRNYEPASGTNIIITH